MNISMKKLVLVLSTAGLALGMAGKSLAYSLPADWEIKYFSVDVIDESRTVVADWLVGETDPGGGTLGDGGNPFNYLIGFPKPGNNIQPDTIEDNWSIFRITSIIDRSDTSTVWSDGDGGEFLYGITWGVTGTDITAVDTDLDFIADSFITRAIGASLFDDAATAVPDINGDGSPDVGLAVFLNTGTDTYLDAVQGTNAPIPGDGPTGRDLTSLADGIPDMAGLTCADANSDGICNDGDDYALQALFAFDTGIANALPGAVGGSGITPVLLNTVNAAVLPFTGVGDGYADLTQPDGSGPYDGTSPYGTPFDSLVQGALGPLIAGEFRDISVKFNVRPHPDSGLTDYGWELNNEDPVFGNAVAEPGMLALMGLGLFGLGASSARRRRSKA